MSFGNFFRLDKRKILISLIVWLVYANIIFVTPFFLPYTGNIAAIFFEEIWLIILSVIMYPFGCAIVTIYDGVKNSTRIENKGLIILGFAIFTFFTLILILFVEGWYRVWSSMI